MSQTDWEADQEAEGQQSRGTVPGKRKLIKSLFLSDFYFNKNEENLDIVFFL